MHKRFSNILFALLQRKNKYKVSACFFENTSNSKAFPKGVSNFCFSFSCLSMVTSILYLIQQTYIHGRLFKQFSGSQAVFRTTFRASQAAIGDSKRRLLEGFSQLLNDFWEASRIFKFLMLITKRKPKIVKTISAHSHTTSTDWFVKIFISWLNRFKPKSYCQLLRRGPSPKLWYWYWYGWLLKKKKYVTKISVEDHSFFDCNEMGA